MYPSRNHAAGINGGSIMAKEATIQVLLDPNNADKINVRVLGAYEDGTDRVMGLDLTKVSAECKTYAMFHGFKQRLVDVAAMSRDTKTGAAASAADKADAIADLIDHYETGSTEWSRKPGAVNDGGLLYAALCKKFGHMKSPSEIREWLDTLDDKAKAALREDDEIAPVIAEIKAERNAGKPKVDTKAILAGLTPSQP
jgi:hypothetical protein